jgi:hypothetical protein
VGLPPFAVSGDDNRNPLVHQENRFLWWKDLFGIDLDQGVGSLDSGSRGNAARLHILKHLSVAIMSRSNRTEAGVDGVTWCNGSVTAEQPQAAAIQFGEHLCDGGLKGLV